MWNFATFELVSSQGQIFKRFLDFTKKQPLIFITPSFDIQCIKQNMSTNERSIYWCFNVYVHDFERLT